VDRAANFQDILIRESGIEPYWFRIFGGGEFYPIADNATYEGRQQNRRVEVMISLARGTPMWGRGPQHD
jgi:flagellar motor protein MotB